VSNNATSDLSSYAVAPDGGLSLLDGAAALANLPNDLAVARDGGGSFLHVRSSGDGTVAAFRIEDDGALTSLGATGGLPVDAGAQGLAAY
jgi:6-phosphogluconolactonase (cycloisomerase 2 family)